MSQPFWSIEPLLQKLRNDQALPWILPGLTVLDLGCGDPPVFLNQIKTLIKSGVGIDEVIQPRREGNLTLIKGRLDKSITTEGTFDRISMLAVMEHLKHPQEILNQSYLLLNKGGKIIITVPSPLGKRLLELLAQLGFVRKEMIHQHENYFTPDKLRALAEKAGFKNILIKKFEFGFNTLLTAEK